MFFVDLILDYLEKNQYDYLRIIKDYLDENCSSHPEYTVYSKRLNSGKIHSRTLLDICIKFGSKPERKLMAKVGRSLIKERKYGSRIFQLKILRAGSFNLSRVEDRIKTLYEKRFPTVK